MKAETARAAALLAAVAAALLVGFWIAHRADAATKLSCGVRVVVDGEVYGGSVQRSYHTSCPFARNVVRASLRYIILAGAAGDGDFYTYAWSPVTLREYRVHCFAHGILDAPVGIRVDCRAGIGARVVYVAHRRAY